MKKGILPSIIFICCLATAGLQGCKKESTLGIDNDSVIKTPFTFYAANSDGGLINSTDGEHFVDIFPPDGYATRLILTSGPNLMILKDNLFLSENMGHNFNPAYTNVKKFPWQTMVYDYANQNRVYITSTEGKGIAYSEDHGKTWKTDDTWSDKTPSSFQISSFTGLGDNTLYAYSNTGNVLFKKDNAGADWTPVEMKGTAPQADSFFLTSNSTTLFLTDYAGEAGVWYSEDEGVNWIRFGQGALPKHTHWNCALSPNEDLSFVVGTDSAGAYRVKDGTFVAANGGLELYSSAYSICKKTNTYKNDVVKTYVLIGTNKGIYRSEDYGRTWDKMTSGVWDKKYVATY